MDQAIGQGRLVSASRASPEAQVWSIQCVKQKAGNLAPMLAGCGQANSADVNFPGGSAPRHKVPANVVDLGPVHPGPGRSPQGTHAKRFSFFGEMV